MLFSKKWWYVLLLFPSLSLVLLLSANAYSQGECLPDTRYYSRWQLLNGYLSPFGDGPQDATALSGCQGSYPGSFCYYLKTSRAHNVCFTASQCPTGYTGDVPNCIPLSSASGSNFGDSCPNNTNNPINIPTGNKFFNVDDYRNSNFLLSRSYNSLTGNWSFSYRQRLNIVAESIFAGGFIDAERADGKKHHFFERPQGFVASSQSRARLGFDGSIYTLVLPNNTTELYDTDGRLLSIQKLNDDTVLLSYLASQIVIVKGDEQLTLTENDESQVSQAAFSDGNTIDYTYIDNNGVSILSVVTHSNGSTRQYLYEDTRFPNYVTGIIDENNNRISSVQYDEQGRAVSSEKGPLNSGIERTQIQYNADGTRTLTNALGKQSTYHFTQFNGEYKMTQVEGHPSANCAGANQAYTYDDNGFMESKTDWQGNVTTYIHNDRGQETSRTEASGTPQARTITTEWHPEFNLPVLIVEPEKETVMRYDENGRLRSREMQARSN